MLESIIIVLFTTGFVIWLDKREEQWIRNILKWFPAILFAYAIPAAITHTMGWDLTEVVLHSVSKDWIVPLAILSVMSALSFKQLRIIGVRPILLFVIGSFAIATLPVILVWIAGIFSQEYLVLFIGEEYWRGLVPIVGGWIGGSTSQLVLKELSECPEALFFSILVLDNILVNIWTILMFQLIQQSDRINERLNITDKVPDFVPDVLVLQNRDTRIVIKMIFVLLTSLIATFLFVDSFVQKVIICSVVGLAFGNLIPWWKSDVVLKSGGVLIILIMAILGLRLNFAALSLPPILITVVVIWLVLHFMIMLSAAYFMKLHIAWVPIASMANLGGISTAPAVTAAYNEEWMPHAILLAILSMVTGTAWGFVTIWLFGFL